MGLEGMTKEDEIEFFGKTVEEDISAENPEEGGIIIRKSIQKQPLR